MTNDGGRPNRPGSAGEPTSYDLQPPHPAGATALAAPSVPAAAPAGSVPAAAPAADPGAGRRIGNRYRLISRLGHGGMGTVWKAHDEVVDRDVAVKEPRVPDHLPASVRENVHQRMQREARAAARVSHPSVVAVHDVVVEDGRPWIVMELVRGHSLGDRLGDGTLDPREAARIGLAVLDALGAAHEAGVLHRDVKPDNVLLGHGDRVVLTDFGIARIEGEQGLTETGAFVGSPEFVAPERVLGQHPGPESDLWSLGVVLYAAVEGVSPFRRSNTQATMQAILSAEPQAPSRGAGVLGALVMRMLHKNPAARPGAAEIRQTLEALARPASPEQSAFSASRTQPTGSKWVPPVLQGNRKAQWGLGGGVVAVATAATLLIVNPFAVGPAVPLHWKVRDEPEIVRASMAVPEDYVKVFDVDKSWVSFKDPSGVYSVSLDRDTAEQRSKSSLDREPKDIGTADVEAKRLIAVYTGDSSGSLRDAKSTTASSSAPYQGLKTAEVVTVYRKSGANEDDPKNVVRSKVIVNDAKTTTWRLEVWMPEKGQARKDGDKLFDNVLKYLKIQDAKIQDQ
ncbi:MULTISPECIES: serine/threonine-protein kinase [Streptomyces]|uniref:serine/threonine-protein kinase n=1 Tax=Streptomyces TaxID=1883 RepID=UPI00345B5522